uniref:Acidic proline-rich protein PRP25-like n=1 Tax=Callorhinus ursinus TaxID=34884 RepID=A0A3Q7QSM9_CALUR|nr:acidic proline-rich protein PRP25-like [Callorhinus ursinus]
MLASKEQGRGLHSAGSTPALPPWHQGSAPFSSTLRPPAAPRPRSCPKLAGTRSAPLRNARRTSPPRTGFPPQSPGSPETGVQLPTSPATGPWAHRQQRPPGTGGSALGDPSPAHPFLPLGSAKSRGLPGRRGRDPLAQRVLPESG